MGSRRAPGLCAVIALATVVALCTGARAQIGPVYPDDSVAAREGLARASELAAAGNIAEALRVIQSVLNTDSDKVLETPGDGDLFVSVRARAHALLLSNRTLLDRYRADQARAAQEGLNADVGAVERTRLLTTAGFEAALRLAQEHMESARFEAARLTLEQLEDHPDRRAERKLGQDAAKMSLALARYLDRAEVRAWAERWAQETGVPGAAGQTPKVGAPLEAPLVSRPSSPLHPSELLKLDGITSHPLQSVWYSPDSEEDAGEAARQSSRMVRGVAREPVDDPWVFPTVVGDVVYTNDGRSIAAWDRFTLQLLWRFTPTYSGEPDAALEAADANRRWRERRGGGYRPGVNTVEDTGTVTVAGNVAVATTGLAVRDLRDGDPRVHAIDASTGALLWSSAPSAQDPALGQSYVRGPAEIVGDTVIVAMRKPSNTRRVAGAYLVGLDLWTGQLRWTRLLGSAGWVFFQRSSRAAESSLVDHGVVYRTDDLGILAAIEAQSGRVQWLRRLRAEATGRNDNSPAWSTNRPIALGSSLVMLSPTREEVLRVDSRTGKVIGRRSASDFGDPFCLVRAGDHLAGIGQGQIVVAPIDSFETAECRRAAISREARMRGRPVVAGGSLLVPLTDGLTVINPVAPEQVRKIAIENPGNPVVLDSHLLTADRTRLHSYLVWDVAEQLLRDRMDKHRSDPRPALTFVELAYRAGRSDLIAYAADRTIDASGVNPASAESKAARKSLLTSLQGMVRTAQEGWGNPAPEGTSPAPAKAAPGQIRDLAVLDKILERIARLVEAPGERVDYLMALGRQRETEGAARSGPAAAEILARAVEAYQQVLEDPQLSASTWTGGRSLVRTDLEATRRLRELVARSGRQTYRTFDAEAKRELAELERRAGTGPQGATGEDFEALARRYPAASAAPEMWARAGAAYERADRRSAALAALGAGMAAAEWGLSSGDSAQRPQLGELAGRLVRLLQVDDRSSAAAQLLERMGREFPGLALTVQGVEMNPAAVIVDIRRRIAGLERRPRIGAAISGETQAIEGWTLQRPMWQGALPRATEHAVLVSRQRREIALWGVQGEGPMRVLWSRSYRGSAPPSLVSLDAESAYLFWASDQGGSLERIDVIGGTTRWKTPEFAELFPIPGDNDGPARVQRFVAPLDGSVAPSDLLLALDEQTAVLTERSGRLAAIDLQSGRTLWTGVSPLSQVHDMAVGPGAGAGPGQNSVILTGAAQRAPVPGELPALEPAVAAFDARTGKLMHQMKGMGADVRWVRTTQGGDVIVGLDHKVASLNLPSGKPNWEINDVPARETSAAWVFGERLFVQGPAPSHNLWLASAATGVRREGSLDPRGRLDEPPIRVTALSQATDANVVFASRKGVVVFGPAGELIGLDAMNGASDLLPPEIGEDLIVSMETVRTSGSSGPATNLHFMELPGGKLVASRPVVLHEDPREMLLLDGKVLVSTESVTLVLPAPSDRP